MPVRRRQDGLTAADRREESRLWMQIVELLTYLNGMVGNIPFLIAGLAFVVGLIANVEAMRRVDWLPHPAIDKVFVRLSIYFYLIESRDYLANNEQCRLTVTTTSKVSVKRIAGDYSDSKRLIYLT